MIFELYEWTNSEKREYFLEYIIFLDTNTTIGFTYSGKSERREWDVDHINKNGYWTEVPFGTI